MFQGVLNDFEKKVILKIDLVLGHNIFNIKIKTKQEIFVRRLDVSSIVFTVRW